MDPTTKEGREALRLRIKTAMIALAGLCNGTRPMRMSGPSQSDDPDLQIAGGLAVGKDALSHIEKLEKERDALQHGLGKSLEVALREREEVLAERDTIRAELERARAGLAAVEALIDESRGVDGLHRNGDLATWDELRTGGRYEEWLRDFDAALSPSTPVTGEAPVYEPSEAEIVTTMCAFRDLSGFGICKEIVVPLLIAAAKARSAKT